MNDLERLDKAIEDWRDAEAGTDGFVLDYEREIESALMAYRRLLASGEEVFGCVEHDPSDHRNCRMGPKPLVSLVRIDGET